MDNQLPATITPTQNKLLKPQADMEFGHKAAQALMNVVKQNGWVKRIGTSDHLMFEAWQTVGKFYGLSVRTDDPKPVYVEYGTAKGFEAVANVINTATGQVVGGATAICLNDEPNWRSKPFFQLNSMAQTRAGSKAMRQVLSWVVALAGFNPTPAEEMDGVATAKPETREPLDNWQGNEKTTKAAPKKVKKDEFEDAVQDNMDVAENSAKVCSDCGVELTDKVFDYSMDKYNTPLCFNHQKEH